MSSPEQNHVPQPVKNWRPLDDARVPHFVHGATSPFRFSGLLLNLIWTVGGQKAPWTTGIVPMLGEDLARKDGRHGEYWKIKEGTYINPSEIPEFVWLLGVGNLMIICDNRNCLFTTICDEFLSKEKSTPCSIRFAYSRSGQFTERQRMNRWLYNMFSQLATRTGDDLAHNPLFWYFTKPIHILQVLQVLQLSPNLKYSQDRSHYHQPEYNRSDIRRILRPPKIPSETILVNLPMSKEPKINPTTKDTKQSSASNKCNIPSTPMVLTNDVHGEKITGQEIKGGNPSLSSNVIL